MEVINNPVYIFFTPSSNQFKHINSLLNKQEFSTQINPLFGFPGLPSYFLSIYLTYSDVNLISNQSFGFGRHNLVIERIAGNAPKRVRVSSSNVKSSEFIITQE